MNPDVVLAITFHAAETVDAGMVAFIEALRQNRAKIDPTLASRIWERFIDYTRIRDIAEDELAYNMDVSCENSNARERAQKYCNPNLPTVNDIKPCYPCPNGACPCPDDKLSCPIFIRETLRRNLAEAKPKTGVELVKEVTDRLNINCGECGEPGCTNCDMRIDPEVDRLAKYYKPTIAPLGRLAKCDPCPNACCPVSGRVDACPLVALWKG